MSSETVGFEPVPISAQEMSWFKTQIAAGQDMTIEDPNVLLNYDYPTSKAAFKALTVAADGTVWARLSTARQGIDDTDGNEVLAQRAGRHVRSLLRDRRTQSERRNYLLTCGSTRTFLRLYPR